MNSGKIFLAKLAQGAIGEENAFLLGTFLVSKFHQLAMSRQEVSEEERRNFYLYIDEFHNFVTPSMAAILAGARKYHLGLVLAHQDLRQLWNRDSELASAVLSNASTRICFRLGDFDAQKLADGFSSFDAKDLQNLATGEAVCRVERAECDFNLKTFPLPKVDLEMAHRRRERVIVLSRERYGRRREEVEAELAKAFPQALAPRPERGEDRPKEVLVQATPTPPAAPVTPAKTSDLQLAASAKPAQRDGRQHRYLAELVKRIAEHKGYRATIEQEILGGAGRVDVSLEKVGHRIACEISVTSTDEQELGNIQKCLAAGYAEVILLASERKVLNRVRETVSQAFPQEVEAKLHYLLPDEFVGYLEEREAAAQEKTDTVLGYKVKLRHRRLGESEKKTRKQAISEVILGALQRLKGGKN